MKHPGDVQSLGNGSNPHQNPQRFAKLGLVLSISFSTQQLWGGYHKGLEVMPKSPNFFHSVNELSQAFLLALSQLWWSILARILVKQSSQVRSAGKMVEVWEELSLDVDVPEAWRSLETHGPGPVLTSAPPAWHMQLQLILTGVPCVSGQKSCRAWSRAMVLSPFHTWSFLMHYKAKKSLLLVVVWSFSQIPTQQAASELPPERVSARFGSWTSCQRKLCCNPGRSNKTVPQVRALPVGGSS